MESCSFEGVILEVVGGSDFVMGGGAMNCFITVMENWVEDESQPTAPTTSFWYSFGF